MFDGLLYSVSYNTLSGDSSFPFEWGWFLCLPIFGDSSCLFLFLQDMLWLPVFMVWPSVVGDLWDSVKQYPWFHKLDSLGMPFMPFMWALWIKLGFYCCSIILWCVFFFLLPPFSLPCGYCNFVLYFSVSGYILLSHFFCWLSSTYFWWEFRLVQPLWKTVWNFLKELNMELPFDPAIFLLGLYLKNPETPIQKNLCTPVFIAAQFAIAKC